MAVIYISPHLDDAVLSCGGLIWHQVQRGLDVQIWTICAGEPPPGPLSAFAEELHQRWGVGREAVAARRVEDGLSCEVLGAGPRYFEVPDCIYRSGEEGEALYGSEESLNGALAEADETLIESLARQIRSMLSDKDEVICPLALGRHVDHQLTRAAVERIGKPLSFYQDYPYVMTHADRIEDFVPERFRSVVERVSDEGMAAWEESITAHRSQISTFWGSLEGMRIAINEYHQKFGGIKLWKPNWSA